MIRESNIVSLKINKQPKLLDRVKTQLRVNHYSKKTEEAYVSWIKRYIYFHNKKHPEEMGKVEIEEFLNHLTLKLFVSSSLAREI